MVNDSKRGIDVDKPKIEVIEKVPSPVSVKGIRSSMGHAEFYRRFTKNFSTTSNPSCNILEKEVKFVFYDSCVKALKCLKEQLVLSPIIVSLDWSLTFKVICDASVVDLGVAIGQRCEKILQPIYYTSKA